MTRAYSRLIAFAIALTGWALMSTVLVARSLSARETGLGGPSAETIVLVALGAVAVGVLAMLVNRLLQRGDAQLTALAQRQGQYIESLPASRVAFAIVGYAALSLFLELAVIRWQAAAISILAFYKNYSLISAFAGLGLGYALARRKPVPLFLVVPLMGSQLIFFWILRMAPYAGNLQALQVNPFAEQTTMGLQYVQSPVDLSAVYLTLGSVFLLNALAFLPIGQLVGKLMDRTENLRAYGLNLLGSLAGIGAMSAVSFFWTPPSLWFAIGFAGLLPVLMFSPRIASISAASALIVVAVIALPPDLAVQQIHSPYQLLEREFEADGDMVIRAAGHFLLTASDYRPEMIVNDEEASAIARYYEFPYRIAPRLDNVLVVGAGAGNDVAAALRNGAGKVDAVEIDPAVAALGIAGHPERPYDDGRVRLIVDDARSYINSTDATYDLIVYGLLDSHSVLSHGANVRMDSFVYTVEALREARAHLTNDGVLSLAFVAFTPELAQKLYDMLTEAFDGTPPRVILSRAGIIYVHGADGPPALAPEELGGAGLVDLTAVIAGLSLETDIATDDWPFLYVPRRVYPFSYLGMVALVVLMSGLLVRSFLRERLEIGDVGFFFLGAGFLLIETKGITELGLTFGNTWQVIGLVIGGILVMAYLANVAVARLRVIRMEIVFLLLFCSLGLGYAISVAGGLGRSGVGQWAGLVVLTLPVLFSGIAFSLGVKSASNLSGVMAANLTGAILGGVMEYTSMRFGFRSLYLFAALVYFLGGVTLVKKSRTLVRVSTPETRSDSDRSLSPASNEI